MLKHAGGLLAVAGWLLMSPPQIKDGKAPGGYRLDGSAKITDWNQLSAHDTATDCERAKSQKALDIIAMARQLSGKKDVLDEALVDQAMHALCVPAGTIYGDGSDEVDSAAPTQL